MPYHIVSVTYKFPLETITYLQIRSESYNTVTGQYVYVCDTFMLYNNVKQCTPDELRMPRGLSHRHILMMRS